MYCSEVFPYKPGKDGSFHYEVLDYSKLINGIVGTVGDCNPWRKHMPTMTGRSAYVIRWGQLVTDGPIEVDEVRVLGLPKGCRRVGAS